MVLQRGIGTLAPTTAETEAERLAQLEAEIAELPPEEREEAVKRPGPEWRRGRKIP